MSVVLVNTTLEPALCIKIQMSCKHEVYWAKKVSLLCKSVFHLSAELASTFTNCVIFTVHSQLLSLINLRQMVPIWFYCLQTGQVLLPANARHCLHTHAVIIQNHLRV